MTTTIRLDKTDAKLLQAALHQFFDFNEKKIVGTAKTPGESTGSFMWPVPHTHNITSYMEWRWGRMHNGIDMGCPAMTPIYASRGGQVEIAQYSTTAGNYVQINHHDGFSSIYMHLSSIGVSAGQHVSAGQYIGATGSTGVSTGDHLHFGIALNGVYVNPCSYVPL